MFECIQCKARTPEPRWYAVYLGDYPRCPRCGTVRLTRLITRDHIDTMYKSFLSFVQGVFGADLYHCRYCRIQFHDRRTPLSPDATEKVASRPGTSRTTRPA